jgi:hypothetical protein
MSLLILSLYVYAKREHSRQRTALAVYALYAKVRYNKEKAVEEMEGDYADTYRTGRLGRP